MDGRTYPDGQGIPKPRLRTQTTGEPGGPSARQLALATARRLGDDGVRPDLADLLRRRAAIGADEIAAAEHARRGLDLPLGDVLVARGALGEADLLPALARAHGLGISDLTGWRPDPEITGVMAAGDALALEAVPVAAIGPALVIATCRPDRAEAIRDAVPDGRRVILTLATRRQVTAALNTIHGENLARQAEGQAPQVTSCRGWRPHAAGRAAAGVSLGLVALGIAQPALTLALVFQLALIVFLGNFALKLAAFAAALRSERQEEATGHDPTAPTPLRQPVVSLLVPLYREREIAASLIAALERLDYPRERLDVVLVLEEDDATTRAALVQTRLPAWIRMVAVPPGEPRTKPRALNFALNFARGEIIGIYDAEDRPDADQIGKVVQRFAQLGPDTACLQGRLDYYNARHNLLSRLFAIEYAAWFRVLLPGIQRIGLFVPLGGTTVFLRRAALADVGGWDAHNVTEDADLGLRLARHGYRTEILQTTTYEEANAAVLPWIRQRSRWQKGYLMTWASAMRRPRALWRDLGTLRFLGMQVQILFAVAGFLVAPLLWSFAAVPLGLAHPLDAMLGPAGYGLLAILFVSSFVLSVAIEVHATREAHLRGLRPFIPVAELYFVLATLSAWRGLAETVLAPFWWAKTTHGRFGGVSVARGAGEELRPTPSAPPP